MDIKSMNFNESMMEFINNVETSFNALAKYENTNITMMEFIESNLNSIDEIDKGIISDLSEREKFLLILGLVSYLLANEK